MAWLSQIDLNDLISNYGLWVVAAFIAIENFGLPAPGESVLLIASVYAGQTHGLNIWPVVGVAGIAGFAGACAGFAVGRGIGYRMLVRHGRKIGLTDSRIKIGEYLFLRHGWEIILFGRFISLFRMFTAPLAGANRMTWRKFLPFSLAGAFAWAAPYGLVAYYAGTFVNRYGGKIGLALAAAGALFLAGTIVYAHLHEAELAAKAERAFPGPLRGPGRTRPLPS